MLAVGTLVIALGFLFWMLLGHHLVIILTSVQKKRLSDIVQALFRQVYNLLCLKSHPKLFIY